ncbi:MAG: hypothetical protein HY273_09280 [Gammaproteobacteria bacterium]|nr:hypothetical protein [Gammaproteobacteria bacterium]
MAFDKASLPKALIFGAISAVLYTLMFVYSGELIELAHLTRQGEHLWFIVPILIAFVFSYVHGTFTGAFWDTLGLKPAQKYNKKKK